MLEHTEYCGNFYGTPKKEAEEVLESGKNLILEIEIDGAQQIKAKYPDAVSVLLLPPSFAEQEARLRGRGTETEDKILARLERTKEELKCAQMYAYAVYNYDAPANEAAEHILAIPAAEAHSIKRCPPVCEDYFKN